ncbi:MAG: molybdopterin-dependent oxidoreductase, partial [Dehalococcoidia bacterium]|nr:molybdopterin-dependent oxidoreductase [Dehalococcoidia bacterium]
MTGAEERGTTVASPAADYKVIGTRPVRSDGTDKVTGRATFGADIKLPGLLQARFLRSPYAHARIKSIDTSKAEALPGVMAVITAADIWDLDRKSARRENGVVADRYLGELEDGEEDSDEVPALVDADLKFLRDHYLASDKVLFRGHPVAAVAAIDQFIADEAIELIKVEYEELPLVLDFLEAMKDSSPLLHDNLYTVSLGKPGEKPSNISQYFQHLKGDPERGLAEADVVVEREFRTVMVHPGYIEAHVTTAFWSPEDSLTVWSGHQGHFRVRDELAELLNHPLSKVKVIPTETGGAFGGKVTTYVQPIAALLSRKAGRPVRLALSRQETLEATGPAIGSYIKLKVGATRDGRLTSVVAYVVVEAGALPGASIGIAKTMFGAYDVPNGRIDHYEVVVNKPKSGPYRAPGSTQATFAAESVIDEICEQIGMEPMEFRLKNAASEGTRSLSGQVYRRIGFSETMQAAMAHEHYLAPLGGPNRGRGAAVGYWG